MDDTLGIFSGQPGVAQPARIHMRAIIVYREAGTDS